MVNVAPLVKIARSISLTTLLTDKNYMKIMLYINIIIRISNYNPILSMSNLTAT